MEKIATQLWLPKKPEQDLVNKAVTAFARRLRSAILRGDNLDEHTEEAMLYFGPQHVAPMIIDVSEDESSDLALTVAADISIHLRRKTRDALGKCRCFRYEDHFGSDVVGPLLNSMKSDKAQKHRRVLATALIHSFIEDTPRRQTFYRDPACQRGLHNDDGRTLEERAAAIDLRIEQDLQPLYERMVRGQIAA